MKEYGEKEFRKSGQETKKLGTVVFTEFKSEMEHSQAYLLTALHASVLHR